MLCLFWCQTRHRAGPLDLMQAHVLRHLVDSARMRAGRMPLQWAPILTFPSSFSLPEPGLPVRTYASLAP